MLSQPLVRLMARSVAVGAGVAAGAYASSVAAAWLRYGRVRSSTGEASDALLDRFMPAYEIIERHQIRVAAPADVTFSAACDLDVQHSRPIVAVFKIREAILLIRHVASRLLKEDAERRARPTPVVLGASSG